jgi:hypothetical protein
MAENGFSEKAPIKAKGLRKAPGESLNPKGSFLDTFYTLGGGMSLNEIPRRPRSVRQQRSTFWIQPALDHTYLTKLLPPSKEREIGDPGRARTSNPLLRRQVLYPVELRDRPSHTTLRRTPCKSQRCAFKWPLCGLPLLQEGTDQGRKLIEAVQHSVRAKLGGRHRCVAEAYGDNRNARRLRSINVGLAVPDHHCS